MLRIDVGLALEAAVDEDDIADCKSHAEELPDDVLLTPECGQCLSERWWTTENVWSAAVLQAKNENDIVGLRECIRPFCELLL